MAQAAVATPAKSKTSSKWRSTLGGCLAGFAEAMCLHPMDTIKTRLQLQTGHQQYKNMFHCASTIVKEEGARALYKGLTPFTTHLMIKYSLRFFTFSSLTSALNKDSKPSPLKNFISGMGAGALEAVMIVTPFEVVKIRLQAQHGLKADQLVYRGPIHAVKTIVQQEGVRALWKGVGPTVIRNASNQACNFMAFDWVKRTLWYRNGVVDLKPWQTIATGAFAGMIGPCLNGPMDVIKTRLMRQKTVAGQEPKYTNFVQAFRVILKEEGATALYKGLGPRLLRLAPGQAITWTVVEQVNGIFNRVEGRL